MKESLSSNTTISHYRIVSKIGAGGMGEVYLAEDTQLDRRVAIKVLPAESVADEQAKKRLVREAKAAAQLDHPNICSIHEVGESQGQSFIVMQYVEGETLANRIQRNPMVLRDVLDVAVQVADALAEAHSRGIIHRDIKPQNIIITPRGQAKVMDFGLARIVQQTQATGSQAGTESLLTEPGAVVGTVPYMSPEQVRGETVDTRSDIFSFGAVLYEMMSGRRPFAAESPAAIFSAILTREPPPLARYSSEVPVELQRILNKVLNKDREERYQTAKDLLVDLKILKQGLEIEAKLERPSHPGLDGEAAVRTSSPPPVDTTKQATLTREARAARTTSSAEYVISGIKQHKRSALLVVLSLLVVSAGLGYLRFVRSSSKAIDSIAVLPFANASNDPSTEYLSDGIAEALINSLSQLQQLRVVARSTAFRYKSKEVDPQQVGRDLNVRAVMTGRVRQLGDALSIQVDLVNATTGAQLWGEEYNRKVSDLLAVKQDISREITEKLRLKLTGEEQKQITRRDTTNAEAYQSYLRGRYHWNKRTGDELKKAIEQFQQAIDRDPNYALAYAGLADCYMLLEQYAGIPSSETAPKAKAAAEGALAIDDSLAEAHTSLAFYYHQSWRWEESEKEFKRAISLNPNYPTAHHWYEILLRTLGRLDEALAEIKRAQELDPLSPVFETNIGAVYIMKGDLDSAMEHSRRLVELDPNFPLAHEISGKVYLKQGRYAEAIAEFQQNVAIDRTAYELSYLGHAYAMAGRRDEALAVLKELEGRYNKRESIGQSIAAVYAGLGNKDQAFAWLEKGFQDKSGNLVFVKMEVSLDPLSSDPRYADLLRRMGLKP